MGMVDSQPIPMTAFGLSADGTSSSLGLVCNLPFVGSDAIAFQVVAPLGRTYSLDIALSVFAHICGLPLSLAWS
jgi:hypothetical protein